jgi:hypothetical protein
MKEGNQTANAKPNEFPSPSFIQLKLYASILALNRVRIVSYPNSGRTWLRVMLGELGLFPRFTHGGAKASARVTADRICTAIPRYRFDQIVFLMREPMDTLVSHYFGASLKGLHWSGNLKDFIRHPYHGIERIVCFHQGWTSEHARFRRFRLIKYEELRKDPSSGLEDLIRYLRIRGVDSERINHAVQLASFENMKRRESSGSLDKKFPDRFRYRENQDPERMKVRKGVVGGHREYMDTDDIEYCRSIMRRHHYDYDSIPYS